MKKFIKQFVVIGLFIGLFAVSPVFLLGQQKLLGVLSITKSSPDGFVTINGERVVDGRSIASPSMILTSSQASSRVSLDKTGAIDFSPNSRVNLSFISSSLSMDVTSGEITVETFPGTSLNVFTPEGNVTLPTENQVNIIKVSVVNSKTSVQTISGKARFNNILIAAGENYPVAAATNGVSNKSVNEDSNSGGNGFNPLIIVGVVGAVAVVALLALSGSSGGGDNPPVTSPTR